LLSKRRKYFIFALIALFAVLVLSGCSPTDANFAKLDPANAGFWDKYFVIPLAQLLDWFAKLSGNYGWSILIVTFIVRLVIFPLTYRQQKSMQEMQKVQPQMLKIRDKYKKDPQKMQQETMKLYQEHNINPMAGCLPILIQMPVLIAFYQAIVRDANIAKSSFLYLQLGQPDPYYILPLLAAVTTYIQFVASGTGDNPQMRIMIWIFPIMIFVLAYSFPAAMALYWVYGNIFTILQYQLILKPMLKKPAGATK
jgi:YidC/Oxa1 family membrane protein insertase